VTISKTNITYAGWRGVGYIIMDPETGAAAYLISGRTAGAIAIITAIAFALILLIIPVAAGAGITAAIAALLGPFYVGLIAWLESLDEWRKELEKEIVMIEIESFVAYVSLLDAPLFIYLHCALLWIRAIEMWMEIFKKE